MSMQQVLIDMDGVLADMYAKLIELERRESGITLKLEDLQGKLEEEAFPSFDRHIRSAGVFRTAPVMKGSIEGMKYLNNRYKVLIVSSATEFPDSMKEKHDWLNEYFPFIAWEQMIFCGSKESICGDIMIDDHPKNLSAFEGRKILFTQPHNIYIRDARFEKVDNWKEIIGLL